VGFGEGGQLTEQIRRRPHSVVLFDEIEKAHRDVTNIFLQILDEGKLKDAQGREIDFKNTVVIMTSNVGTELIQKENAIGFLTHNDASLGYDRMKEKVLEELKKAFKPEFLNRIDETIVFRPLAKEELMAIVDIMLSDVNDRLAEKGIEISLTKKAKGLLVNDGYDPKLGARPLRRAVENNIEDVLSEEILRGKFGWGSKITGDVKENKLVFSGTKGTKEPEPSVSVKTPVEKPVSRKK
jgi:ATP-dependent Clp protease ATP-binding subunit ClpC